MDNFIVSARKYRPQTFKSVVGQQALTTTLKNAISGGHLAHAYLFCGPRGVGKTTCARIFAKTINCLQPTSEHEACNECESCVAFNEQRSFNIHELDAASNNGTDDIKQLIDQVRIPPQIGKYSVYIVDEVHMLSNAAFNAFLKTLEEPPAHAMFILATTEKHKIIPTILSRCQIYDFNRITAADTVAHLQYVAKSEGVTVDLNGLNVIAQKSDGGMRDALSIFDQLVSFCGNNITYQGVIDNLNVLDYEYYFRIVNTFLDGNVPESLLIFNDVLKKGFDAHHFITGLAAHLRDLLVSKDASTLQLLEVGDDIRKRYMEQAQVCSNGLLFMALKITNDCDLDYRISKNKRLLVELALIRLCQLNDEEKSLLIDDFPIPIKKIIPSTDLNQSTVSREETAKLAEVSVESNVKLQQAPVVNNVTPTTNPKSATITGFRPQSISISKNKVPAYENTPDENGVVKIVSEPEPQIKVFSDEEFQVAWSSFQNTLTDEDKVGFLNLSVPERKTGVEYELLVNNPMQENEAKRFLTNALQYIRIRLSNSMIQIKTRISEETEVQRSKSPEQVYADMVAKNPQLEQFRKLLSLEID